jgi:hypothetical protein
MANGSMIAQHGVSKDEGARNQEESCIRSIESSATVLANQNSENVTAE